MYEKPNNYTYVPKSEDRKSICIQSYDWVTSFIQPASVYTRFKSELSQQKIKLATAVINKISTTDNNSEFEMIGIIKLVNLCFEKRVFVRLSSDSTWTSFTDFEAKYKNSSSEFLPNINAACDIDEFEFQISLPLNEINETTHREFVIGFETPENGNYWDNNNCKNYRIDYCQLSVDKLSNGFISPNPYTHDYKPNMRSFQTGYTGYRAWNHFAEELSFY